MKSRFEKQFLICIALLSLLFSATGFVFADEYDSSEALTLFQEFKTH